MCGRATFAIVESSACMIVASITEMVMMPWLGTATNSPGPAARRLLLGLVPELPRPAVVRVDFDRDTHAGGKRQVGMAGIDRDPHRQPLHHLHPVARGILRRQQGEA